MYEMNEINGINEIDRRTISFLFCFVPLFFLFATRSLSYFCGFQDYQYYCKIGAGISSGEYEDYGVAEFDAQWPAME